ncbi:hypothetical protein J2X17_001014 [Flavobacterium aquidurense]|nr:hypothetical protein [Flavobacterium aquidurense]
MKNLIYFHLLLIYMASFAQERRLKTPIQSEIGVLYF